MKKALNAILDREYANSATKRPSARAVQLVIEASDGDIRSGLNTLQFIVGEGSSGSSTHIEAAEVGKKKGKKRKSNGKVKEDEGDESANKALSVRHPLHQSLN
jgi:replication-associated recombination protein RarA